MRRWLRKLLRRKDTAEEERAVALEWLAAWRRLHDRMRRAGLSEEEQEAVRRSLLAKWVCCRCGQEEGRA